MSIREQRRMETQKGCQNLLHIRMPIQFDGDWSIRNGNTCREVSVYRRVSHALIRRGRGPNNPEVFRTFTYCHTVWSRTTNFGMCFNKVMYDPYLKAAGHQPPNFRDLLHTATRYETQQQNFAWWSNYARENFYRVDHAPCPGHFFCDTNADARSVCGS